VFQRFISQFTAYVRHHHHAEILRGLDHDIGKVHLVGATME